VRLIYKKNIFRKLTLALFASQICSKKGVDSPKNCINRISLWILFPVNVIVGFFVSWWLGCDFLAVL